MRSRSPLLVLAFFIVAIPALARDLPDSQKTPGVPLVKVPDDVAAECISSKTGRSVEAGDTITLQMVCTHGYTQCVRKVSAATKNAVYASYGLTGNHNGYCESDQGCEVDHLVSLELGGSNEQGNLWPEPYENEQWNAHVKDQLENFLHAEVCTGRISLKQAQTEVSTNWIESFKKRIAPNPN
jgi:hypothetical protein